MRSCARETWLSPWRRRQQSVWLQESQLSCDANRDFSCTFWIIQIYFSDSGRFLCVNCILRGINTSFFGFFVSNHGKQETSWYTKPKKSVEFTKGISLRTVKVCRFEIIDGVKDPKKTPYSYLDCWRGLVRVTVIYLEYTQPRGQARVYRFDIHRKSLRPEEYIWKLWKLNVSSV